MRHKVVEVKSEGRHLLHFRVYYAFFQNPITNTQVLLVAFMLGKVSVLLSLTLHSETISQSVDLTVSILQ